MSHQWLTAVRRSLVALATALALLVLVPTAGYAAPPDVRKPSPDLTASWWQTFLALPASSVERCDLGTGPVVFLGGTSGGTTTRSCTIPAGKSILVPLINVECSQAEENGDSYAQLKQCAHNFQKDFTNLSFVIDGTPVKPLQNLRVQSKLFRFTSVQGNAFGVVPATNTISVSDGHWALIQPLSPGQHTISFGGSYPPGPFNTQVTYHLTVR